MGGQVFKGCCGTLRIVIMVLLILIVILLAFTAFDGYSGAYGGGWTGYSFWWSVLFLIWLLIWNILMYVDVINPGEKWVYMVDGILYLVAGVFCVVLGGLGLIMFLSNYRYGYGHAQIFLVLGHILVVVGAVLAIILGIRVLKRMP